MWCGEGLRGGGSLVACSCGSKAKYQEPLCVSLTYHSSVVRFCEKQGEEEILQIFLWPSGSWVLFYDVRFIVCFLFSFGIPSVSLCRKSRLVCGK